MVITSNKLPSWKTMPSLPSLFVLFAFPYTIYTENHDFSPQTDERKTEFSVLTNDGKNDSLLGQLDVSSNIRWTYSTKSGSRIKIYDKIFTNTQQKLLRILSNYRLGSWSYRIPEQDVKGGQLHVSRNNIPWYNELNCEHFFETTTGNQLQNVVANFVGNKHKYYPYQMVSYIIRRGDFTKIHTDASHEDDEVSMMIYLNNKWRKNDYGELFLYDDDKEIVAGVVPHYGRVVVWDSCIPYLAKPPSVAYLPGQRLLHIRFTKNLTKVKHVSSQWMENKKLFKSIYSKGLFIPDDKKATEIQVQRHSVFETESKEGKKIFVFDGLISKDTLDDLRSKILNFGVYYYDDSYDEKNDNVQWIAGFQIDDFIKSNLWKIVKEVATFVSGGHNDWFPYDVSCNLLRNADATQIHHDCSEDEDEWTFLLYLNPGWTVNDYGETVFYERNDDNTEIITEVMPKYGRVAIFQGVIPHSARPPSRNYCGARLSFAVKLSTNEWTARTKSFEETFNQISGLRTLMFAYKNKYKKNGENHDDDDDADAMKKDTKSSVADINDIDIENVDSESLQEDPVINDLESKFKKLLTTNTPNIEELRLLSTTIHQKHFESFDEMEEFLQQIM